MKMIASRQLVANPGKIWNNLEKEGAFIITKDGMPRAILLPTSEGTLLEDLREEIRGRSRRAVTALRRKSGLQGTDRLSQTEIEKEISEVRRSRKKMK